VVGFYSSAFRDLFFGPNPPQRLFRAVVTVLAGCWRPSWITRVWLALFFLSVRLQARLKVAPPYVNDQGLAAAGRAIRINSAAHPERVRADVPRETT
jgi:hypothetical protein